MHMEKAETLLTLAQVYIPIGAFTSHTHGEGRQSWTLFPCHYLMTASFLYPKYDAIS